MARLARLKFSMTTTILFVAIIFGTFLIAVTSLIRVSPIYAVILTIVFILAQYLVGPAIVRASTRLRYLRPGEHPWLESTVKDLASKTAIPMPKLAIVPDQTPNAFVFGRTTRGATLAVHEGLLKKLNQAEIQAVIGHELGHIKHKDILVMTALSALPLLAYLMARFTFEAAWLSGRSRKKEGKGLGAALFAVAAISYIIYIVTLLCVMKLSRLREHYADAYSAYVTGAPRQMESALTKITYGLSLAPKPNTGARTLYIADPALAKQECRGILQRKETYDLDKDGVLDEHELELAMEKEAKSTWNTINTWFTTHPPTYRRILLLREIGKEMNTGRYSSDRIYIRI